LAIARGATWVSIHNGGGVGWGEVINGGFGMVLDGTKEASKRINAFLGCKQRNFKKKLGKKRRGHFCNKKSHGNATFVKSHP
jgi:urocanate hydratase